MGDEKPNDESAPDPWADLLGDGPGESAPEFSFSFDEPAEASPAAAAGPQEPAAESAADDALTPAAADPSPAAGDVEPQLDDEQAAAWLDDVEPAPTAESEAATAGSSIEIGTGRSGIVASDDVEMWGDASPAEEPPPTEDGGPGGVFSFEEPEPTAGEAVAEDVLFAAEAVEADAFPGGEAGEADPFPGVEAGEADAFPGVEVGVEEAAVGLAGAAAAAPVRKPGKSAKAAKQSKAKKGGIGQMIGVMLGGVMAIPITLGILIWGFQKDPFKVTKHVPESVAFLLPQKFQPGFKKTVAVNAGSKGSPLDALGTAGPQAGDEPATDAAPVEPPAGGDLDVGAVSLDEPAAGDPVVDDAPVTPPGDGDSFADPLAAAAEPEMKPVGPSPLDVERAAAEAVQAAAEAAAAAAAEAAAADRKPLDAAVAEALTAVQALEDVADAEDPARKKLLVELYKALATVGEELAILERISADAGRPLAATPESLDGLLGRLPRHRDELVRLGRQWISYANRSNNGVVLPVTFRSSRRIGPYWSSKVTLPLAKEGVRELVVLSRAEPAVVAGDDVMLTGTLFDGDVIWAADVRPLAAAGDGFEGGGAF